MAFITRYLDEYRAEIRLDIVGGMDETLWKDVELNRSIQRAVDDLSRFYPLEAVYEHTIIDDPPILPDYIVAPAAGTWKDLTYKPIKPGSDSVTSSPAGTTYTRDTDYTMDYSNGRLTIIAAACGGTITAGAPLLVDYTQSKLGVDLSAIITNMIRVVRVEYPVDKVPQQFVAYNIWNDFMYIGSQKPGESQTRLNDKEHVAIYYEKPHTAPTYDDDAETGTAPSYPAFLDQVITIGAGAYALLMKAIQYEHQAVTDVAYVDVALDKVATYLETNNTNDNAKEILANIMDDTTNLRNAITEALIAANTYLDDVDATDLAPATYGAEGLLATAIDGGLINKLNIGGRVPEIYADYSRAVITRAQARTNAAMGFIQEANTRLSNIRSYIEEAGAWMRMGETFIGEAQSRISNVGQYLTVADRFRAEGLERRNEFWSILRDKAEYRKRMVSIPVRQPATGGPVKASTTQL